MATFVKWYGEARLKEIRTETKKRMERAVRLVSNSAKESLGIKAPPHSQRGEAPHLVTGELRRSIATQVDTEGEEIIGRVGTNKNYAKYLELPIYLERPFLLPAVQRTKAAVQAVLSKKMN